MSVASEGKPGVNVPGGVITAGTLLPVGVGLGLGDGLGDGTGMAAVLTVREVEMEHVPAELQNLTWTW